MPINAKEFLAWHERRVLTDDSQHDKAMRHNLLAAAKSSLSDLKCG